MNLITKKVYSRYFDQILAGQKTYEIRLADWKCEPGDMLELIDIDDQTGEPTGRSIRKQVGTVVNTKDLDFWTEEEIQTHGYQVIGLLDENKDKVQT